MHELIYLGPNNPLLYDPSPQPYYGLTTGLSFAGNSFLCYTPAGRNPAISAWLRHPLEARRPVG